jgi:hypothetical protein
VTRPPLAGVTRRTRIAERSAAADPEALLAAPGPVIVKGLAADWPLVRAGEQGADAAARYLLRFDAGLPVTGYTGAPDGGGRYGYAPGLQAMNFVRERVALPDYLARMGDRRDKPGAPFLYVGSTDLDTYLPGLAGENPLPIGGETLAAHPPLASIWIGNRTVAPAHWDMSNNIAVCAVGRRRFTLFPPDQAANLYPGPLEPTPAGQVVSLVDFDAPDFAAHPGFRDALVAAEVAELEPGDVLIYPALWWHQVEALDPFNILVNYWWNAAPAFADNPMTTLMHGFLSLRGRTLREKQAWRALFDYYLFGEAEQATAHLPAPVHGALAPLDQPGARRLRAGLLQRLNR